MNKPIIIALDFESDVQALEFLEKLDPQQCRVKIGKELFTSSGPEFVSTVVDKGFDVFLDLKYHDIPNTVANAVARAADLGVWMINVHASGGLTMMEEARKILEGRGAERPLLIAVTVLTSLAAEDLAVMGIADEPGAQVLRLARLTQQAGLDGVVCSAAESAELRQQLGDGFLLVTPGIRRAEDAVGDQKRVVGPAEAMRNGSNYLVVGRPITRADSPQLALDEFNLAVSSIN